MSRPTANSILSIFKGNAVEQDDSEDSEEIEENRKTFVQRYDKDHIISSKKLQIDPGSSYVDRSHKTYKKSVFVSRIEDTGKAAKKEKSVKNKSGHETKQPKKEAKARSVKRDFFDTDYGKLKKVTSKQHIDQSNRFSILRGLTILDTRTKQKTKKDTAAKKAAENVATSTIKQRLSTNPRTSLPIPNVESSKRLSRYSVRNKEDSVHELFNDEDFTTQTILAFAPPKYKLKEESILPSRGPSYSGYELPLHIKSKIRYSESCKRYHKQFKDEIHNLIEFQPTALEAAFFARHMAYTTLWPPLHTKKEVDRTSKLLHPWTEKEQKRLKFLMMNDIPRWTSL